MELCIFLSAVFLFNREVRDFLNDIRAFLVEENENVESPHQEKKKKILKSFARI